MTAKTTKNKRKKDDIDNIIASALALAVEKGWNYTSLREIAQRSGLTLAELHEQFDDKMDILSALERLIDQKVLATCETFDSQTSVRDRLFEILMERFDALNQYREGICAILNSFRYDPKQALIGMPHLCRSMTWMLEAAGVDTMGTKGAIRVAGLSGVYLRVLKVWKDDDSSDLSRTMSALDKALDWAERTSHTLRL